MTAFCERPANAAESNAVPVRESDGAVFNDAPQSVSRSAQRARTNYRLGLRFFARDRSFSSTANDQTDRQTDKPTDTQTDRQGKPTNATTTTK